MESEWPSKADDYQLKYPIGQGACGLVRTVFNNFKIHFTNLFVLLINSIGLECHSA
jgi:hypothetical protein